MTQNELNKQFNKVLKVVGKQFHWGHKGGLLFSKKGSLFFVLIVSGRAASGKISFYLSYKWFAFDDLFWEIVGLPENKKQPLSFHADGAWTAPAFSVRGQMIEAVNWDEDALKIKIEEIIKEADDLATTISEEVTDLDKNLAYIEGLLAELLKRSPKAVVTVDREKLMTALLKGDFPLALSIADEKIAKQSSGGFSVGGLSFFQLAKQYIERPERL